MHERIEITRAEFEAAFGKMAYEGSIGICLYSEAGVLMREYLFIEDKQEIEILEALYAL